MKKIFLVITTIILIDTQTTTIFALSPAPTGKSKVSPVPSTSQAQVSTDSADIERIEKIKEMVANKVAQLKLVEKRGILAVVKEVTNTQITVEDRKGNRRIIDIDELTKFQENAGSSKTFGISDIEPGDSLAFVGLYNKETKRLLARFIVKTKSIPLYFEGLVLDKNAKDFSLKAVDEKGNARKIDIETSTKTQSYTKEDGAMKSGFSKISVGQRIFIVGFEDPKEKNTLIASRIVYFPEIPASSDMKRFQNIGSDEVPVSTGSGKKLTPITK